MAFEVSCSQCQGRLMVEQAGQVVACPHCGTHLAIPEAAPAESAPVNSVPDDEPATAAAEIADAPSPTVNDSALNAPATDESGAEETVSAASTLPEIPPVSDTLAEPPAAAELPADTVPPLVTESPVDVDPAAEAAPPVEQPAGQQEPAPQETPSPADIPAAALETQDEIPALNPGTDEGMSHEATLETATTGETANGGSGNSDDGSAQTSPDNPFAGNSPDFGAAFGSATADENPFAGGDFNFGDGDAGSMTTVSEFVPATPPIHEEAASQDEATPSDATGSDAAGTDPAGPTVATAETGAEESPPDALPAAVAASPVADVVADASPASIVDSAAASAPTASAPVAAPAPTAASEPVPAYQPPAAAQPDSVPRSKYVLVLSWASAATIAALFLAYLLTTSQTSQLESLPDVKPPKKDDKIVYKLVPEDVEMPPGHLLTLGETQRYGNLKVTATRVTRGPIQFEHYDASSNRTREDGPEVLKLWLKFENVSSDQAIAPLDELVFQRDDRDFENVRANIFLARASQKSKSGTRLMVYDLNTSGDWNLKGQQLQHEIPPGGQLETYIPTTPDGIGDVLGSGEELVWRVHFRKGYSPKNFGVTTIIEVTFGESEIAADSAANTTPAPADQNDGSQNA